MDNKDANLFFSNSYRQDYFLGHSFGMNPLLQSTSKNNSIAFVSGFNSGRLDYEEMNGQITKGIPLRIITIKVLEDFLLDGLLRLSLEDIKNYSYFQLNVITKWYQSGLEQNDPTHNEGLFDVLKEKGINIE